MTEKDNSLEIKIASHLKRAFKLEGDFLEESIKKVLLRFESKKMSESP